MGDVKTLHHLWLVVEGVRRVSQDHSKIGGFEKALREKRQSASEAVVSMARIRLRFRLETELSHEPLHWSVCNTYVLCVELRPARDSYSRAVGRKLFKNMSSPAEKAAEPASHTLHDMSRVSDPTDN